MDENEFLARVRAALQGCPPAPRPRAYEVARLVGPEVDRRERFEAMARDAGMDIRRAGNTQHLIDAIEEIVTETGARRVLCPPQDWPGRAEVLERLRSLGCQIAARPSKEEIFAADLGLTSASAGIAETGSLVEVSGSESSRLASLAPPVHVAVLSASAILGDLIDWAERAAPLPAHLTFITGPSKSADIEQQLVVGVHGPGRVFVLIVE